MKNNEFILSVKKVDNGGIILPKEYTKKDSVTATFYEMCIRLYKDDIALLKGRHIIFNEKERKIIRTFYTHQDDYEIRNGVMIINTDSKYKKMYEIKKELLMVKNNKFIDLVEINNINNYLDKMGLDNKQYDELKEKDTILKRNPSYKLKYWFK